MAKNSGKMCKKAKKDRLKAARPWRNDAASSVVLSPAPAKPAQAEYAPCAEMVPYDENLLERARTQWQFGDWESLSQLPRATLQHHPERAKLALLAAAGHLQTGNNSEARQFIRLAQDWGCGKQLISRILIAGVHNSLGRAAAIGNQQHRALRHFENAINIGTPGGDAKLLTQARAGEQLSQLGLTSPSSFGKVGAGETARRVDLQAPPDETTTKLSEKYGDFSSAQYWEDRYQKGGTSGYGSYGRLAEFKAKIINRFIEDEGIESVIEFGCGDGNQLSMLRVKNYVGVDISSTIVQQCRSKFQSDSSKSFYTNEDFSKSPQSADLTLSLDVIFHLIEDIVFESYMKSLFHAAERYCIIYACDEDWLEADATHVRRRKFTKWIAENIKGWRLMQITYNKYPHDGSRNPKDLSFSNFYFYEKVG